MKTRYFISAPLSVDATDDRLFARCLHGLVDLPVGVLHVAAALRSGFGVHNQTTSGNLPEGHMRSVVDALCPVFSRPCVPWSAAAGPTVDSVVRGQFGRLAAG